MTGTSLPTDSSEAPRHRPKGRREPSDDDFDQISMVAPEDQKGFSYLVKFPNDPLR